MSKGQIGASKSDKAWAQVERDLRLFKKSGEFDERVDRPVTLAEQLKHLEYLDTFEGQYGSFGRWEQDLIIELHRVGLSISLLVECSIFSREFKTDGWEKGILPKAYALTLLQRSGF